MIVSGRIYYSVGHEKKHQHSKFLNPQNSNIFVGTKKKKKQKVTNL